MIAVDTSAWIGFLRGDRWADMELFDRALQDRQVLMAPAVLAELLSDAKLPEEVHKPFRNYPFWRSSPVIGSGQGR